MAKCINAGMNVDSKIEHYIPNYLLYKMTLIERVTREQAFCQQRTKNRKDGKNYNLCQSKDTKWHE